jgi:SAM-dependent methyltransferase
VTWQQRYLQRYYNRATGWVDGTTQFHSLCQATIPAGSDILEIGAGGTNVTSQFLSKLGHVHGIDIDPDVRENTALTRATVLDGPVFPFSDASFDACVSNFVLEHVADPVTHFAEVARVLRPGGAYVLRTPNRFHYVALASALLPHRAHELVANRLRRLPAHAHGPHRTYYAANSRGALQRLAARAGLRVTSLEMVEKEPSYGMISPLLFIAFMAYERVVNSSDALASLRSNIFAVVTLPSTRSY